MRKVEEYNIEDDKEKRTCEEAICIVSLAQMVDDIAIDKKYWDSQWYLDFKDDLNRLSIDDDRCE